jgi:hypothetical protein
MAEGGKSDKVQSRIQTIGAIAAMIAAAATLLAYFISTPHDLNNWYRRTTHGYFVDIDEPKPNTSVGAKVDIKGRAELPSDWNLVVLVQTPDELRYYVSSGGAATVSDDHTWHLDGVAFGSEDPKQRRDDLNKDYKIVALLVDEEGQQQVQAALLKPEQWMPNLPHHAAKAIRNVHLAS